MAKLILALTPGILFNEVSNEFTHEEQVIPLTERSICLVSALCALGRNWVNCVLMMSTDYSEKLVYELVEITRRRLSKRAKFCGVKFGQLFSAQLSSLCEQFLGQ